MHRTLGNVASKQERAIAAAARMLLTWTLALALAGCRYGAASRPGPALENDGHNRIVRVFYATDRQRTSDSSAERIYGSKPGELSYGTCDVSLPPDHRMGEVERPSVLKLDFRENTDRHVVILSVKAQEPHQFYREIADIASRPSASKAFIFVHGYNVGFAEAARRTAQMSYDLGFNGAPVFYSWPSQNTLGGYRSDEESVAKTQVHLKIFLEEFAQRSSARKIYLIAHSMGNRALTGAVIDAMNERPDLRERLAEIVLAAPDIDAEVFVKEIAPKLTASEIPVTLYASSRDEALKASREFNASHARAGDCSTAPLIVPGIDSIDATFVDTSLIGHSYYAESRSILSDIFDLIKTGSRPAERFGLEPANSAAGAYWRFRR